MNIVLLDFVIFLLHCVTCDKPLEGIISSAAWHFTSPLYNATIYENSAPKTYVESPVKMGIYTGRLLLFVKHRVSHSQHC